MNNNKLIVLLIATLFSSSLLFSRTQKINQEIVLKETQDWVIDTIEPGYIHYKYATYYRAQNAQQIVNVLELDFSRQEYNIEIKMVTPSDSLSNVAKNAGAIAGINGTYESDASFVKTNNYINTQVTLPPDHLRFWKHEGAFFYDGAIKNALIEYGSNDSYSNSSFPNILSGAPMLVDNYSPVGENFVGDITGINLNSLEYEDYRRHQGLRNPRTAVALTEGGKLLLVTVDGRRAGVCEGMTAKELTQFIVRYFNPKSALNIDGGGSTSMYIKGSNECKTDIVNYPCDNDRYKLDHYGQRTVRSFILVKKIADVQSFGGGSGVAADPYIISTVGHLQAMHDADYTNPLYFKMTADLNLAGENWIPVNSSDPYSKIINFDGNGHVIKNLTVKGASYASLFGVLCGSCKNMGVINADIESTNGAGIIAGYAGLKGPNKPTGIIENCYTTGKVSGTDAVGGIVGNIGKPNGAELSQVKNCYSTASVLARNTTGNSRAGGIVGINYAGGITENCYATGKVTSSLAGASGITGWSDTNLSGCVAMNDSIINKSSGNLGRISAFMGSVNGIIAQGVNCWGYEGTIMKNAETILSQKNLNQGEVTVANAPYDGVTKSLSYLSNPMSYFQELNWDFASDNNIWAQTMSNGYPIFQWLFNRGDYSLIDGHSTTTAIDNNYVNSTRIFVQSKTLFIESDKLLNAVNIYNTTGQLIHRYISLGTKSVSLALEQKGVFVVSISSEGFLKSYKLINN